MEQTFDNPEVSNDSDPTNSPTQFIATPSPSQTLPLDDEKVLKIAFDASMNRFNSVLSAHDDFVKKLDNWDNMYRAGTPVQNKDTLSQISSMVCYNSCEDWVATLMDAHFSVNPPLETTSKRGKDPKEVMMAITDVLWQNAQDTDIEENSEQGFREGVKTGTFTFKTPLVVDEDLEFEIITVPGEFKIGPISLPAPWNPQKKAVEKIQIEDRVPLQPVNLRNLYFRYDHKSWIIERMISDKAYLEKKAKDGVFANLEKALKTTLPGDDPERVLKQQIGTETQLAAQQIDEEVELLECHHIPIYFGADDQVPEEFKNKRTLFDVVICNRQQVIKLEPSKTKEPPYIICPFIPQEGSELGIGIPQIIEPLLRELNTRRNQSLDANTFGLYCMIVANMKYIKKPQQLKIRPNGVIELKGVPTGARSEDIVSFVRPPVEFVQVAMQLIDRINAEIVTTTRLKGVMSGEKVAPNPSATEMASIMKEALKSIKMIFRRIDRNIFKVYYERVYTYFVLNRQKSWVIATTKTEINPQTGAQMEVPMWKEISPEQIYSDGIDVRLLGSSHMEDEIVNKHQNMQLLDLKAKYLQIPMTDNQGRPVKPNMYNGLNDVYNSFGIEDTSSQWEPVPPPPPPPPPPEPDKPKISFSFKGEDLLTIPPLQALLMETAKDLGVMPPPPPQPQQNPGMVMQGGPGQGVGLNVPPPTPADIAGGANNPRAIREPIGGNIQ